MPRRIKAVESSMFSIKENWSVDSSQRDLPGVYSISLSSASWGERGITISILRILLFLESIIDSVENTLTSRRMLKTNLQYTLVTKNLIAFDLCLYFIFSSILSFIFIYIYLFIYINVFILFIFILIYLFIFIFKELIK